MIKFDRPINLNGTELIAELKDSNILIKSSLFDDAEGGLWLNIEEKDKAKAKEIVDSHNGNTIPSEPTIEQKLANAGLTVEDLRTVLGL
jgi:hypothetical protein